MLLSSCRLFRTVLQHFDHVLIPGIIHINKGDLSEAWLSTQGQAARSVATKDSPDSPPVRVVVLVVSDVVLDSVSNGPEVVTVTAVRLAESVWFVAVSVWFVDATEDREVVVWPGTVDVVAIPVVVDWVTNEVVDVNPLVVVVVVWVTAVDVETVATVSFCAVEFDNKPLWLAMVDVVVDPADLSTCDRASYKVYVLDRRCYEMQNSYKSYKAHCHMYQLPNPEDTAQWCRW